MKVEHHILFNLPTTSAIAICRNAERCGAKHPILHFLICTLLFFHSCDPVIEVKRSD
jgi:hypothetical protein